MDSSAFVFLNRMFYELCLTCLNGDKNNFQHFEKMFVIIKNSYLAYVILLTNILHKTCLAIILIFSNLYNIIMHGRNLKIGSHFRCNARSVDYVERYYYY